MNKQIRTSHPIYGLLPMGVEANGSVEMCCIFQYGIYAERSSPYLFGRVWHPHLRHRYAGNSQLAMGSGQKECPTEGE